MARAVSHTVCKMPKIEPTFVPGDLVCLKSNKSQPMVVEDSEIIRRNVTRHEGVSTQEEYTDTLKVRAHWLSDDGKQQTILVRPECLRRWA